MRLAFFGQLRQPSTQLVRQLDKVATFCSVIAIAPSISLATDYPFLEFRPDRVSLLNEMSGRRTVLNSAWLVIAIFGAMAAGAAHSQQKATAASKSAPAAQQPIARSQFILEMDTEFNKIDADKIGNYRQSKSTSSRSSRLSPRPRRAAVRCLPSWIRTGMVSSARQNLPSFLRHRQLLVVPS